MFGDYAKRHLCAVGRVFFQMPGAVAEFEISARAAASRRSISSRHDTLGATPGIRSLDTMTIEQPEPSQQPWTLLRNSFRRRVGS
ncbi:hypothetical protein [Streptomyces mirabilis]|uniref:hypothetical protein n=1 Tax=Streptomyces mirabilis TaxID=68239 RepID=UPI002F9094D5